MTEKVQTGVNPGDKRVARIMERFARARQKRQQYDPIWAELDLFDRGEQWKDSQLPPWVPKPVTNFIHLVKTTKRAAVSVENPVGMLRAVTPANVPVVERLQKAFAYVCKRIGMRKIIRQSIEDAKLLGTGIVQVYWDEYTGVRGDKGSRYEGEIRLRNIDIMNFYPDPNAFELEDCAFIHVTERKSIDELKTDPRFRGKVGELEKLVTAPPDRGEHYDRDYQTGTRGLVDFHAHYERIPQEGGYKYKVTYIAGDKFLHEQELKPNRYPFAICYDFKQRQEFWGKSTCEMVLSNQKLINKTEQIIAMIATLLQNPQKVVSKQSGVNPREVARYSNAPGHTFVANGDPANAVHWLRPPDLPQYIFTATEQAKENVREITGITQAYMGQSVGSVQTSRGVEALIERSTMRDRDQMFDVEMFIEDLSRLIIDFMVNYYNEPRYVRIDDNLRDPNTAQQFFQFIGKEFSDIEYDFFIDVSSRAPITTLRRKEEAQQLLEIQGQYGFSPAVITPKEFVERSDFADAEAILTRMQRDEQTNKIQEIMEIAQILQQAMAQGISQEDAYQFVQDLLEQREQQQQQGIGSAAPITGGEQMLG